MKKKLSINWLIFAGIVSVVLSFVAFAYGTYIAVTDQPAKVSDLSIGWSQSKQQTESIVIPTGTATMRVCGNLDSNRAKPLSLLVFDPDGGYHGKNVEELIQPGEFCSTINIESALFSGEHIVKIYDGRQVIATIDFEVQ